MGKPQFFECDTGGALGVLGQACPARLRIPWLATNWETME